MNFGRPGRLQPTKDNAEGLVDVETPSDCDEKQETSHVKTSDKTSEDTSKNVVGNEEIASFYPMKMTETPSTNKEVFNFNPFPPPFMPQLPMPFMNPSTFTLPSAYPPTTTFPPFSMSMPMAGPFPFHMSNPFMMPSQLLPPRLPFCLPLPSKVILPPVPVVDFEKVRKEVEKIRKKEEEAEKAKPKIVFPSFHRIIKKLRERRRAAKKKMKKIKKKEKKKEIKATPLVNSFAIPKRHALIRIMNNPLFVYHVRRKSKTKPIKCMRTRFTKYALLDDMADTSSDNIAAEELSRNDRLEKFDEVSGRLCLLGGSTKYTVSVGEITRRIGFPETLHCSLINGILRKGKAKDNGKKLRSHMQPFGLGLPSGRRKSAPTTAFTAFCEEEAMILAKQFRKFILEGDLNYDFGVNMAKAVLKSKLHVNEKVETKDRHEAVDKKKEEMDEKTNETSRTPTILKHLLSSKPSESSKPPKPSQPPKTSKPSKPSQPSNKCEENKEKEEKRQKLLARIKQFSIKDNMVRDLSKEEPKTVSWKCLDLTKAHKMIRKSPKNTEEVSEKRPQMDTNDMEMGKIKKRILLTNKQQQLRIPLMTGEPVNKPTVSKDKKSVLRTKYTNFLDAKRESEGPKPGLSKKTIVEAQKFFENLTQTYSRIPDDPEYIEPLNRVEEAIDHQNMLTHGFGHIVVGAAAQLMLRSCQSALSGDPPSLATPYSRYRLNAPPYFIRNKQMIMQKRKILAEDDD